MLDGQAAPPAERRPAPATGSLNTTIGVVATSAALSKAEVGKLASVAHDGMARAIRPAHSMFDGDTIFGLATGEVELTGTETLLRVPGSRHGAFNLLLAAAADTFAAACTHAVLSAPSIGALPSYLDLCPSARPGVSQQSNVRHRQADRPASSTLRPACAPGRMAQQRAGRTIALVPTMGALHVGHLALDRSRQGRWPTWSVVSIFVNPLQFDRADDFDRYPRPIDADVAVCRELGVDAVYAPLASGDVPAGLPNDRHASASSTATMEGAARPGHFDGVTTVVTKLFTAVRPDVAVFGEKDFQQLAVVRRLSADLDLGVDVIGHPTVREPDGLAMSSRNTRLDPASARSPRRHPGRARPAVSDARGGERSAAAITGQGPAHARDATGRPRRLRRRCSMPRSLAAVADITDDQRRPGCLRIAVAAFVGDVRLIDNRDLFEPDRAALAADRIS